MFYNLCLARDRVRFRADREAELAAVKAGTWPRDISDRMRWCPPGTHTAAEWARHMCEVDLAYLDDIERRLSEGGSELERSAT